MSETFIQQELLQILLVHIELAQELSDDLLALERALPLGLSLGMVYELSHGMRLLLGLHALGIWSNTQQSLRKEPGAPSQGPLSL